MANQLQEAEQTAEQEHRSQPSPHPVHPPRPVVPVVQEAVWTIYRLFKPGMPENETKGTVLSTTYFLHIHPVPYLRVYALPGQSVGEIYTVRMIWRVVWRAALVSTIPAFIVLVLVRGYHAPQPVQIGQPAPIFTLPTVSGGTFAMTDHPKKITIINFFTTWCPPCQAEAPDFARFVDHYHRQVTLVMIDRREGRRLVASFVRKYGLKRAVVVLDRSDSMAEPYGITGQPETFGVNKRGIVEFHMIGPMNVSQLVAGMQYIEQHSR